MHWLANSDSLQKMHSKVRYSNGIMLYPLLDLDNLIHDNVQTQFEQDLWATTTVFSVIQKFPEIRQKDNETVIQYVSRCAVILLELKAKTDVL
jgi:hypothetical protein